MSRDALRNFDPFTGHEQANSFRFTGEKSCLQAAKAMLSHTREASSLHIRMRSAQLNLSDPPQNIPCIATSTASTV
jgi:hypothetical protein